MNRKSFPSLALIAVAALAAMPGYTTARNDGTLETLETLRNDLIQLNQASQNILNAAEAGSRDITPEEQEELDRIYSDFERTEASIASRERAVAMAQRTGAPSGRKTTAAVDDDQAAPTNTTAAAGASRTATRNSLPAEPRDNRNTGKHGFLTTGDFLMAVVRSSAKGGSIDPRLAKNAAPGQYGSEGVGQDGGFAVPPDFRTAIMVKVMGEDSLLPMTDNQTSSSNGMTFPADETTPWDTTGGIQAFWEVEAGQKQTSKPKLTEKAVKMNKVIALVPLTDELLEDAPAMASYVNRKAPEKINYKVNEAILRGDGIGKPLGIIGSPGTVVVAKESGQAADTITFANILDMWSALTPGARRNAKWIVNPDAEAQLMRLQFPGSSGNVVPLYMPPGGLSASPYGTLLGKPIMPQEAASAVGDQGDVIFGDLNNYLTVTKQGGIKTDTSIHIWFDYDITAFRFVLRVGGEPWWNTAVAPAQVGAKTRGYFAVLADRA